MTFNEDTGEEVVCLICQASEFWECGHLVGSFDLSFGECAGGEIYERFQEFIVLVEDNFRRHLIAGSDPKLNSHWLMDLWSEAFNNFDPDEIDYVHIDHDIFIGFVVELLEEAGAIIDPGPTIDPGGPGMTSAMSLLFSKTPADVIDKAIEMLSKILSETLSANQTVT